MKKKEDGEVLPATALTLKHLREALGVSRQELASRLGLTTDVLLGKYERGDKPLSREALGHLLEPLGQPEESVEALLALYPLLRHEGPEEPPSPVALNPDELARIDRTCLAASTGILADLRAVLIHWKKARKAEAARRDADERWPDLRAVDAKTRRGLVEIWPRYRTWAMAERVCEASVRAAADRADTALELARFALFIAERTPGPPSFRARTEGYCWAHIGNALRVGNDFDAADQAFARAWDLWRAGADSDPGQLPEWRLLVLEASLRRAQHRFPEALERLGQARERSADDRSAAARILLQQANVYEQMENPESALAALDEAELLLAGTEEARLLCVLAFNRADNLARLERFAEAEALLPGARRLAIEQANALDLTRVTWLEAKVGAGRGRKEEAMALLEQARGDFAGQDLPYDAALSTLDLALLWLEAGRAAEVRSLALGLAWVFESKRIRKEALAALALFYEAAKRDAATVELTRQVIAEIERVRRSAPPSRG